MAEAKIVKKGEVTLQQLIEKVKRESGQELGAIGCFVGVVRGISESGTVKKLFYEAAEAAEGQMLRIMVDLEKIPGILCAIAYHIIDELAPGEDAIYIVIGGRHRKEVFEALPLAMDRIKKEAQVWKKEFTTSGERWVVG
ncbi:MAG: molybdenum cofactor biosynthesis protein MoaE [Candidatus Hadarchaeales archaeon]